MSATSGIPRRRRALIAVLSTLGLAAVLATTATQSADASAPTPPSGWTQTFLDDFNGAAGNGVNTSNWQYDTGTSYPGGPANWGTGEVETMTNSTGNVSLDGNGNLRITPLRGLGRPLDLGPYRDHPYRLPAPGRRQAARRGPDPDAQRHGHRRRGLLAGVLGAGCPYRGNYQNWPGVGELDVMENVQGLNKVWATMHCGTNPGGPCNETTGIGNSIACPGTTCQSGFHTYSMEWDRSVSPEAIRFYVDGVNYHTVTANQVDATTWANATNHGYFLILNVAMGGAFPDALGGGLDGDTQSGHPMVVDYVQVLSATGSGTTPPPTGNRDAYSTIQAESYDSQSGTSAETTADTGGGQDIGSLANGDWALYKGVDFGSTAATQFHARVASGAGSGVSGLVEVRLDSRTSTPIGSFSLANTGGWQTWRTVPANISSVTGTHDVYLTFTSGQPADFVNVNWFDFGH